MPARAHSFTELHTVSQPPPAARSSGGGEKPPALVRARSQVATTSSSGGGGVGMSREEQQMADAQRDLERREDATRQKLMALKAQLMAEQHGAASPQGTPAVPLLPRFPS